ncbi:MAG: CHAT domain-containing protein [Phycisphaerales bacterium]|nr:CHAT domain-containing protein [Phycisphaerales bacterium]
MNATQRNDGGAESATALLERLEAMAPEQRAGWLRARGDANAVLIELSELVETLAVSEVKAALQAGALIEAIATELVPGATEARVRRAHAQALAYGGRFEDALRTLEIAIPLAEQAGSVVEAARARMASMHALNQLGRFRESIVAGDAAREGFLAAGEPAQAARADANLGATYRMLDDPAAALRHYDRARPILAADPGATAQLDTNRGVALMDLDRFDDAARAFGGALPVFESRGMGWAAAIVEGNLAELRARQGRIQAALSHYEQARRHLESDAADAEVARILAEEGDALALLGALEDAQSSYERALPTLESHGLATEAVRARLGMARVQMQRRRLREADLLLSDVVDRYAALGQPAARGRAQLLRCEARLAQGDFDTAAELVSDALASLADRPTERAAALIQRADLLRSRGDFGAARRDVVEAAAIAESLDLAPLRAEAARLHAAHARAAGDPSAAIGHLRESVRQVERVRGTIHAQRLRSAFLGRRLAAYEELVQALLDRGGARDIAEAFEVMERARSRWLLDQLQPGAPSGPNADDPLEADLAAVQSELNGFYSRVADGDGGGAAGDRREDIRRCEQRLAQLESRIANAGGAVSLFAPPAPAADVQRRLAAGERLIQYFSANNELLALVLSSDGLTVHRRLGASDQVADLVQQAVFQVRRALRPGATDGPRGDRLLSDTRRAVAALYAVLIAPLAPSLAGAERLIIAPHGALHSLPFAALWDGAAWLVERYEIEHAISGSLFRSMAGKETGASRALVVGVADDRAPQIAAEARQVAARFEGADLLLGSDATAAAVTRAAPRAQVLHLAAHGYFSSDSPLSSGLRLADRWLTVGDICRMKLDARLTVLSGCETGRSVVAAGDDLLGLLRGFVAAGARRLLVSQWTVPDSATLRLMDEFYHSWCGGMPAAAALRRGQLALLAEQPHPAAWAGFFLMGAA